jgi:transmembrane sensor
VTNVVEFGGRSSIEHEARKWLIRMDSGEPLTEAEKHAWTEWLDRSPLHREEFSRLTRFWSEANMLAKLTGGGIEPGGPIRKRTVQPSYVSRILMAASVVLASTILGWWGLRQSGGTVTRTYETDIGQQKTVLLSEGSSIQLNTDTRIEVVYSRNSRKIRLTRGEALFAAASDPNRVFEVHIAESVVRAVGTAFDVYVEGQKVEVIVTSGLVEVLDGKNTPETTASAADRAPEKFSNSAQLKAGEVADFYSGSGLMNLRQLAEPELRRRLAWRGGYLEFSGEALSEVVAVFNRYSTVKLEIGDPKLASIAIGGRFQIGNLDAAVGLLSETFGFRARRVAETRIRLESEVTH